MKIKEGTVISTDDFWYDFFDGGYIKPETFLEDEEDIVRVKNAVAVIRELQDSLEDYIEYL